MYILSDVKGDCLVSKVVALTNRRVMGLSSPQGWTSVVWAVAVKLFGEDMILVLQEKLDMSSEGSPSI